MNINTNLNSLASANNLDNLSDPTLNNSSQNLALQSSASADNNLSAKTAELAFSASFLSNQINNQVDTQQTANTTEGTKPLDNTQNSSSQPPVEATPLESIRNLK